MKKHLAQLLLILYTNGLFAQTNAPPAKTNAGLSPSISFVDTNHDTIITLEEARVIFDNYQNDSGKTSEGNQPEDLESVVIELIGYIEGVNCNDIKKSFASKRFIDVYYANKFFDAHDEVFGLLMDQLRVEPASERLPQMNATNSPDTLRSAMDGDFPKHMITDRPDQTEAPQLTPRGFFQVETGCQSEIDHDKVNNVTTQSTLYNTTLWKYGVTKNLELRAVTQYAADKTKFKGSPDTSDSVISMSGFSPISVGSKIALEKGHGLIPSISLLAHLELPYFGSENYRPGSIIPRFRFLFTHTLNERFTFSYNLGAEWEDGTNASTGIYTASLGASLFRNLSLFIEAYGFLKEQGSDHRLDGGLTYFLTNSIQLDCSGGVGLSERSPDYFVSAGISFRFNAFNKEMRKRSGYK